MTLRAFIFFCKPYLYIVANDTNGKAEFLGFAGDLKDCQDPIMSHELSEILGAHDNTITVLVEANES